jgi:TATA-binding protein-associated factor Taf7
MASEGISQEETNAGVGVAGSGGGNEEGGGGDEDERMEELEGSEEEKTGDAAGPENSHLPATGEGDMKFEDRDEDDDDEEKMDSGTEDDEEDGADEVAERNRKLLSSGCGKQQGGERKKVLHAFWSALWPILEDSGWSKVRVCAVECEESRRAVMRKREFFLVYFRQRDGE